MAKSKSRQNDSPPAKTEAEPSEATWRERLEVVLFIAVEVLCLVLFVDFLFFGFYVK